MGDQFAVIEGVVPSSTGTVDYTSPNITDWQLAIICWGGNYLDETDHATMGFAFVTPDDGANTDSGYVTAYFRKGRSTSTFCRFEQNDSVTGDDVINIFNPDSGGLGVWAVADFSAALSNGVRLNWTDVSGVSVGVRGFKFWILLIGGAAGAKIRTNSTPGFEADLLLRIGIGSGTNNHALAMGACANDTGLPQGGVAIMWPGAQDPVQCHAYASSDDALVSLSSTPTATTTPVTAFGATDWTGSTGLTAALKFTDERAFGASLASFSGSGTQSVTPFSFTPKIVIGAVTAVTTPDAIDSTSNAEVFGVFVTDGTNTFCVSIAAEDDAAVGTGADLTKGYSRWASGEVNLIDRAGGTAFRATSVTRVSGGLSWDVQTAMSGHVLMWAVGEGNLTSVSDDTEGIADSHVLALISRLILSETVAISDGLGGLELADGLTALQDTGSVFQGGAVKGEVFQGGAVSGVVEG